MAKKKIDIFTNIVYGGWSPEDIKTGIGGSEEKLIEWAREMAKDYDVTVYMNGTHGIFDGVKYVDHKQFKAWEWRDMFVSFKASHKLVESISAGKIVHWTTEIEPAWPNFMLDAVDQVLTISDFHNSKMRPKSDKFQALYLWADLQKMDWALIRTNLYIETDYGETANFDEIATEISKGDFIRKENGSMLYSSSFDRGLEELLKNWPKIKEKLGLRTLYVTYGWDFMKNLIKSNPHLRIWKEEIEKLLEQDGIIVLGRVSEVEMNELYWKCQYWCLPLNNPNSELFCINAIKAQYGGAIPVVRRIGALAETVNKFISWDELIGSPKAKGTFTDREADIVSNRLHAERFSMPIAINKWKEIIEK